MLVSDMIYTPKSTTVSSGIGAVYSARFMDVDAMVKDASRHGKIAGSIHGSGKGVLETSHYDKEVILIFLQCFILNPQQLESRGLTATFSGFWGA